MSGNYASAGLTAVWNGKDISEGLQGAGSSPNGDLQEVSFDLKGRMTISQLANQGGIITVTYTQTADSLKDIDEMAATIQTVNDAYNNPYQGIFTFEDPTGNTANFVAWNAVIINTGDEEWAEVVGEREVTWHCEKLIRSSNVAEVVANIASYL